jgi:uncharacterized protein YmfQ (DUF2313 family)
MGLTLDTFKNQIVKLLPPGQAFSGDNLHALVQAFAPESKRLCDFIEQVFTEAIPSTTSDCLTDWERICALPKSGFELGSTTAIRRNDIIAQLISTGGQTPAYFILIAAALGYTATIESSIFPFRAGKSRCGDYVTTEAARYVFIMTITNCGIEDDKLEYLVKLYKPAHTIAIFRWGS